MSSKSYCSSPNFGQKFVTDSVNRDALYPETDKHFAKLIWGARGKYEAGF